jgi:hypothetical protein
MFCPVCHDEYRPGFTRCATCDVDLVEAVGALPAAKPAAVLSEVAAEEAVVNFCGFLHLEEARTARDKVLAARRRADILICEAPRSRPDDPFKEEYWLRVAPRDFRAVADLVGFEPSAATEEDESFVCSACGASVPSAAAECPGCGLGFGG